MSNKLKKFLEDATKTHLEKIYEEKQMNDNGVYSPIEFTLSEKEQKKVNEKLQEINGLFNSSDKAPKADEYEAKAKAFDETIELLKDFRNFSKQTEPHSQRMKEKRRNYVQFCDEVLREIKLSYKEIIDEYESGESYEQL